MHRDPPRLNASHKCMSATGCIHLVPVRQTEPRKEACWLVFVQQNTHEHVQTQVDVLGMYLFV